MAVVEVKITGNLTADPDLRYLPSGVAVAEFTVASTPRIKRDDEWVDGETVFLRVKAWRKLGEDATEALRKGDAVVVTGKLKASTYETKEGDKRTAFELNADTIGKSVLARRSRDDSGDSWGSGGGDDASGW